MILPICFLTIKFPLFTLMYILLGFAFSQRLTDGFPEIRFVPLMSFLLFPLFLKLAITF